MALKGDMKVVSDDISFFLNEAAERGGVACISTAGSGVALDQSKALVTYKANPSGCVPIGVLLNDMVDIDQSKYQINIYKDEVQKGGKVTLLTNGWVVTNKIEAGSTPTAGANAYLSNSGLVTATSLGAAATPLVGRFYSTKDEDGYAKLVVNLP
jgi:hypothetical protein